MIFVVVVIIAKSDLSLKMLDPASRWLKKTVMPSPPCSELPAKISRNRL
jgi:hypothetical protein